MTQLEPEIPRPYDLLCQECGRAIRVSHVVENSAVGALSFYEDEDGLDNRDFHWHVP